MECYLSVDSEDTGKEKATNFIVLCINFHYKMPAISFEMFSLQFSAEFNCNRYINHGGAFSLALKRFQLYLEITERQHFLSMYQTVQGTVVNLVTLFNIFFHSVYIALELILARNNLIT